MTVLTAVTNNGPVKSASTWSPAQEPKSTDELIIPNGIAVEMSSTTTVVSLKTEGTGTLSNAGATKPLTLGGSGHCLNLSKETVLGTAIRLTLSPTAGATTEIITNGVDLRSITFSGGATSKHKLTEDIKATGEGLLIKAGIFKSENFTLNLSNFIWESATGKEIILGTSLVKLSGEAPFASGTTTPTLSITSSTWECTAKSVRFSYSGGNAVTLGNLRFTGEGVEAPANTVLTVQNLELLLTGATRLVNPSTGSSITVQGTITKSSGNMKIEREHSGTGAFVLKKTSGTIELENVELENVTAEGGATFKDVNGKDLGGNTGWTFVFTGSFTHSVAISTSLAAQKVGSSALTQSTAFSTAISARKVASAVLSQSVGLRGASVGLKSAKGTTTHQVSLVAVAQGIRSAMGQLTSKLGLSSSSAGHKVGLGSVTTVMASRSTTQGSKTALGTFLVPLGLRAIVAGSKAARGELSNTPALGQQFVGSKSVTGGALANAVALGGVTVGMKVTSAALQTQAALSQVASAVAVRLGAFAHAVGLGGIFKGQQIEGEVLRLTVEIEATAITPVSLAASQTMTVVLTAVPLNP